MTMIYLLLRFLEPFLAEHRLMYKYNWIKDSAITRNTIYHWKINIIGSGHG